MDIELIGNILSLHRGYDLTVKNMKDGIIPVAGSNGIIGYHDTSLTDAPAITVGRSGSVGKVHYYETPIWPHNTTLYVDDYKGNHPRYLYYLLSLLDLEKICDNSVVPSLNRNFVYPLKVPFIKGKEKQDKIIKSLIVIDQLIDLKRKENALLESMARQIYDYWFVQFDFPNKDGKPYKSSGGKMVWNEKLKREIPEEWGDNILEDIANITMGQSPEGGSYNDEGEGILFYQGSTDFGVRFPKVRMYTTAPTRLAMKGDILMSVRAPVGAINIANANCCIGRGLASLNSKIGSITHLYFVILDLKSRFNQINGVGTTFGAINKDQLHAMQVVRPSNEIVEEFDLRVNGIFEKQMFIEDEINELQSLRDYLLPLLMNGQVTIKD